MITAKKKRILVVDDSAFMRKLISDMLNKHPMMEVIGIARNGKDAVEKVRDLQPDVLTMDIEMPVMNGLEALKFIMDQMPVPVVILSSTTKHNTENAVLAIEYGAVDVIAKPGGAISLNLHEIEKEIVEKVFAASNVVIQTLTRQITMTQKRYTTTTSNQNQANESRSASIFPIQTVSIPKKKTLIAKKFVIIGTSTGGPRALQEVITRFPAEFQYPILIVQHMPPGFTKSLAERLNGLSEIVVKEAEHGELIENGTAYIAPGGLHLKFEKSRTGYQIVLDGDEAPRSGHRPAVNVLLESAATHKELEYVTAIMTGMGYDGKEGMELLRTSCKTITIAESKNTSVVYGMPKAIIDAGLSDEIKDVQQIANAIIGNLK
ncbi:MULTISPECIES: chemotaxis response regulator protein-glutamate methylesterase [unclassified Sporosarcina]|uniref:protein-glutamate methylesterase/protein-glutamine glutaminase n=2 Tax=Sporosarcina TaxID=1569 RepID=UPI000C1727D4|nr:MULTISPECIES: chemotaxis response regulator protein-glutamate methylesterase [unclassified Sporosarcina]PID00179.1 chemotaxis response regulator protein-glutamate methylesterase [Sporosarcina sp. P29]PID06863.1 chemotaxis response regulator protein-glutamate methylesterase [Sporosarcina sp. P30]PID10057.1 chemotaxis response regulator protein-glutamate methylesterase [Sporosarcina sp. P31]PID13636.1 chemotaxis response regulator protein-glutamate methylesterase [Sporosarcina sp. P32b]